ncbi:MAG: iron ABC transporter permease [Eubacteriales bacterium]|nr:iron ABC transporter permease [Eubacteriales bacterium]
MKPKQKNILLIILFVGLCFLFFLLSVAVGAVDISVGEILRALFAGEDTANFRIIYHIRLPRTLVAMLVGAALAVAGIVLQGVMRNPLATPNIIGVSSGGGIVALAIIIVYPQYYYLIPAGAFVGALLTTSLIYGLAWKEGIVPTRLILAGVAVNTILGAGNKILLSLFPTRIHGAVDFMVGGLSGTNWQNVRMITPYVLFGLVAVCLMTPQMNILMLGDELAAGLGLRVERTRRWLIILSALLAGAAVSAAGLLGFVGLIVPHIARALLGNDHRYLVPGCIFLGAFTLMACDLLARWLFAPFEVPVGVIMSILGGPFFLLILRQQYRLS